MSALESGAASVQPSADMRRADWIRLARVAGTLLIVLVAFLLLRKITAPAAGLPGMVEMQLAGTRETLVSLLRAVDHAAERQAVLWDTGFILLYGTALIFALEKRHPSLPQIDRLAEKAKDPLRIYTPWFLLAAVVADLLQNLLLVLALSLDPLRLPKGTAILATALVLLALANFTLLIAVVLQCLRSSVQIVSALRRRQHEDAAKL